jgi:hypothetical protein
VGGHWLRKAFDSVGPRAYYRAVSGFLNALLIIIGGGNHPRIKKTRINEFWHSVIRVTVDMISNNSIYQNSNVSQRLGQRGGLGQLGGGLLRLPLIPGLDGGLQAGGDRIGLRLRLRTE